MHRICTHIFLLHSQTPPVMGSGFGKEQRCNVWWWWSIYFFLDKYDEYGAALVTNMLVMLHLSLHKYAVSSVANPKP
jgi:hypothetical protein